MVAVDVRPYTLSYAGLSQLNHGQSMSFQCPALVLPEFFLSKSDISFLIFRKNNKRLLAIVRKVGITCSFPHDLSDP